MREPPLLPISYAIGFGPVLDPGMVLAIEPFVTMGGGGLEGTPDGWGARTLDGSPVAGFERMVAIRSDGPAFLDDLDLRLR
jgi:methionyl aminopeptidase